MEENNTPKEEKAPNAKKEKAPKANNDSFWKLLITAHMPDFLEFFMNELYHQVDHTKEIEFLDKEFDRIFPDETTAGRLTNDKLAKLPMKVGLPKFLYTHIEIQGKHDKAFARKMWHYFIRIYSYLNGKSHKDVERPITAIAVYTSDHVPEKYESHGMECCGGEYFYKFNTYIVRDQDEKKLIASKNIFSIPVLAALYVIETDKKDPDRLIFKKKLAKLALERGYSKEQVRNLLGFIQHVVTLEPKLDEEYFSDLKSELSLKSQKMGNTESLDAFVDYFHKVAHGKTMTDIKAEKAQVEAEKAQVEAEKQQVEAKNQQVEAEKQQVEAEKAQIEAEKVQVEAKNQRLEADRINTVKSLLIMGLPPQQIAHVVNFSIEKIQEIEASMK